MADLCPGETEPEVSFVPCIWDVDGELGRRVEMRLFSSLAPELGLRTVRRFEKPEKAMGFLRAHPHIWYVSTGMYPLSEASWSPEPTHGPLNTS